MNQKDRNYIITQILNYYFNKPDERYILSKVLCINSNIPQTSNTFNIIAYGLNLKDFENCIKETFNININLEA